MFCKFTDIHGGSPRRTSGVSETAVSEFCHANGKGELDNP